MASRAPRAPATLAAFVLHRYDWSETSLILDLFTREQGRVAVVAKGAKRPYSQLRSVLLPFQRLHVSIGKPPKANISGEPVTDIHNLRAAEWAGGAAMLTGAALFSGFYLNELLMKFLARSDPHAALFDIYTQTLPALTSPHEPSVQSALRAFELALLKEVGLLPDLSTVTLTQETVDPVARYALLAEAGVTRAGQDDAAMPGRVLIGLQAALEHGSLQALQQACSQALSELKPALRSLLHYHLGSPMLRTRQVMVDVQMLER